MALVDPPARNPVPGGLATAASYAWRLLLVIAAGYVVGLLILRLRLVVIPVVLAAAVAALLYKQVDLLDRLKLPRSVAALLVTLGWTVLVLGALALIGASVVDRSSELAASVQAGIDRLRDYLGNLGIDRLRLQDLQESVTDAVTANREALTTGVVSGATLVAEAVAGFLLFVVVLFFFLRDGSAIWGWLLDRLPSSRRPQVDVGGRAALSAVAGYLRGTAIIALADSVAIGIALAVLGVPLVLPLAVLVFLGAFVPVVGAALAGGVAVLVALVFEGPVTAGLVLVAVVVVQQVEGDVLAPIVFGRALSLHPLVVIVVLTAGGVLGGILGAAASVPIAAAVWAVLRAVRPQISPEAPPLVGTPDADTAATT